MRFLKFTFAECKLCSVRPEDHICVRVYVDHICVRVYVEIDFYLMFCKRVEEPDTIFFRNIIGICTILPNVCYHMYECKSIEVKSSIRFINRRMHVFVFIKSVNGFYPLY